MSLNTINSTTAALSKVAGLVNSLKVDTMYAAFPSGASVSNKLITESDIGSVTEAEYSAIQTILS